MALYWSHNDRCKKVDKMTHEEQVLENLIEIKNLMPVEEYIGALNYAIKLVEKEIAVKKGWSNE